MTRHIRISRIVAMLLMIIGCSLNTLAQTTPDPGIVGPYAVTKDEYNLGDAYASLDSLPIAAEVRASVHYPTSLSGGPYPVIVLLHGRHSTCYRTTPPYTSSLTWPCATGFASIESFQGYDYHARFMASHGYIVISISCNAINARDGSMSNSGMPARGQLVQYHLDLWNNYNSGAASPLTAEIGTALVGKLDMQRIGTMGHSRGGEGVVYHALLNRALGSPYGIKAVLTLAPVDFFRRKLNGIPLMNIAPYCDGDVSNIQGVKFYDDVRYTDTTDESPKHNVLMMGGNHNFYNTVWTPGSYIAGTADDWDGVYGSSASFCGSASSTSGRLDTTEQKAAYNSYASAFFRTYVGGEQQFMPILDTRDRIPPVTSMLDTDNVFVSWHPGRTDRLDINRIDTATNETINTMSGNVTTAGLLSSGICGGGLSIPLCGVATSASKEPHRGNSTTKGLAQQGLRWDSADDYYNNEVPASQQDLTYIDALQFRAALRFNECTPGLDLNFTVQMIDSAGAVSSQQVTSHSNVLFYQPGNNSVLPKVMFNAVRIPIDSFSGINKKKVRNIRFVFDRSTAGSILITDIAFVNSQCGRVKGVFGYSYDSVGNDVIFADTITQNYGDTVTHLWSFGDPSTGTADTTSAHNPTHIYSAPGTYTVCLYTMATRRNQRVCTDTVCKTITIVPPVYVTELTTNAQDITVVPNPAKDYLHFVGVQANDRVKIINSTGQIVLETTLKNTKITLPNSLANGLYYVSIQTSAGVVSKKIMIAR